MWPSATVGTFLCVLALNAKEISFFLPGALLLQAILFSRDRSPSGYWHSIARVAAPVMYSAWFIIYYMSHLEGGWENHVVGGNTKVAVGHSLMFLMNIGNVMNLGNWSPWVHVVKAIVTAGVLMAFALSVYLLVVRRREGAAARTSDGGLRERLYLAGIFVMTMAIVARTTHPSAYYLLIPAWSFYLIITIMMWKTGEALNVRWGKTITVTVGVLIFQIGFLGNFAPGAAFRRIMDQGRNLSESYAEIRVALGEQSPEQVRFILPKTVDGYWYFFRGLNRDDMAADRYITPFMLRKNMLVPVAYEFGSAVEK